MSAIDSLAAWINECRCMHGTIVLYPTVPGNWLKIYMTQKTSKPVEEIQIQPPEIVQFIRTAEKNYFLLYGC